jgi:uncharacterized protein with WD repeat
VVDRKQKPKPDILCLWDVESGRLIRRFEGVDESCLKVAFSPDGRTLVAGCNAISLWDVENGKRIRTFEVTYSTIFDSVEFSPDGKRVISGDRTNAICLWDVETGKRICTFGEQHSGFVYSTAFSPDGRWLVTGSEDTTLAIWDMESGKRIRTFKGHSGDVRSVRFSPSGRRIVSGSGDSTVLVWQPFLNEVKEAEGWAREVRGTPAVERKNRFRELIQALATTDYRTLCRTRERVLASGPECLDLLAEVFPPVSDSTYVVRTDHWALLVERLDADSFEVRDQAQEQLIGYGSEIMDWVKAQRSRTDLSPEVRNRLGSVEKALATEALKVPVFEVKDLGQTRAVLLLIELQDLDRLRIYAGGSESSYATHLARRACGR